MKTKKLSINITSWNSRTSILLDNCSLIGKAYLLQIMIDLASTDTLSIKNSGKYPKKAIDELVSAGILAIGDDLSIHSIFLTNEKNKAAKNAIRQKRHREKSCGKVSNNALYNASPQSSIKLDSVKQEENDDPTVDDADINIYNIYTHNTKEINKKEANAKKKKKESVTKGCGKYEECDSSFEKVWEMYPACRKGKSRKILLAQWRRHCIRDHEKAVKYVREYLDSRGYLKRGDSTEYIKLLPTLLNSDGWKDWEEGDLLPANRTDKSYDYDFTEGKLDEVEWM